MNLRKTFGTNKEKEESGVWVDGPDGTRFLIARANNPAHTRLSAKLMKPQRTLLQLGQADDKVLLKIAAEITSRTILLDWKGVKADDGTAIPYTVDAAAKLLLELPDFADWVVAQSKTMALYQDEERAEEVKNS
jgi:hypothetical protein